MGNSTMEMDDLQSGQWRHVQNRLEL